MTENALDRTYTCRTCLKCGWVYFAVSRAHAEGEVKQFNEYFATLSKEQQDDYGGKGATIEPYEACWCGNPHTNFRESREGDCPAGVTMSGIIFDPPGPDVTKS